MKKYLFLLFIVIYTLASAQGPSLADYQRAVSFQWSNLVNKKIFNSNVQPIWYRDNKGLAFITQDSTAKYYKKFDFQTKRIEPLFDHDKMALVLSDSFKTKIYARDLPIQSIICNTNTDIEFVYRGTTYSCNLETYSVTPKKQETRNPLESKSPDGKWIAYNDNYNLYIKSTQDGSIRRLSSGGKRHYEYGTFYGWSDIIEGEDGERPKRLFAYWSPDSKWIQTYITDMRNAKKMYLLDWSIDTLYKPKLLSYYRGSPGDTDMVKMIPVFYNVMTGEEIIKSQLSSTHTNPIQYEWSSVPTIVYQENAIRGYQAVELHQYDLIKKTEQLLYRETSTTNIDNYISNIVEPWNKALILSEKSGWKQLYTLDLVSKVVGPLTSGEYYINNVVHIDTSRKWIYFTASGKELNRNPYYQHLYKIHLTEKKTILLTPENANHDISISDNGEYFVDNISTLNQPTETILRSTQNTNTSISLSKADVKALASLGLKAPEPFTAVARDNKTIIYGALWKPSNFDPSRKYPVIDQSYTGPHTYMYPRNYIAAFARSNHALAELGFIVITVDGMGTANRSKEFHNVSYKNMGKNLEDHKLAILQLGRIYNWIDTNKVGIFGHSAGGYDAGHAVLEYPEFYKVAVASSADHDFRMEKDWWPEMYLGWPIDSSYHKVSNITMAPNLKGKLLITHGGIDENVNPSATFKLAEALIKANKEFDMLILPSQRHGYNGIYNDYFTKKKWNYFVEHLLGVKAIWEFSMR